MIKIEPDKVVRNPDMPDGPAQQVKTAPLRLTTVNIQGLVVTLPPNPDLLPSGLILAGLIAILVPQVRRYRYGHGQALFEQYLLHIPMTIDNDVGQDPAVMILPMLAIAQSDTAGAIERSQQGLPRLARQRLIVAVLVIDLRGVDTQQPDLAPVHKQHGIPIEHLANPNRLIDVIYGACLRRRYIQQDTEQKKGAGHGRLCYAVVTT